MYLIDTNIHAAFLLQAYEDDALTRQYLAILDQIYLVDRLITDYILTELETFLVKVVPARYQLNPVSKQNLQQLTAEYITQVITSCTVVTPEVQTIHRANQLYRQHAGNHYLSLTDCLLLASAEEHSCTLFTKDQRLQRIGATLGLACVIVKSPMHPSSL